MLGPLDEFPVHQVPQPIAWAGSSDRNRLGADYYLLKAKHDIEGFAQAIAIAQERGTVGAEMASEVMTRFLYRLALTMRREQQDAVADQLIEQAEGITGGRASG